MKNAMVLRREVICMWANGVQQDCIAGHAKCCEVRKG
jgi:hypothetical protein